MYTNHKMSATLLHWCVMWSDAARKKFVKYRSGGPTRGVRWVREAGGWGVGWCHSDRFINVQLYILFMSLFWCWRLRKFLYIYIFSSAIVPEFMLLPPSCRPFCDKAWWIRDRLFYNYSILMKTCFLKRHWIASLDLKSPTIQNNI